MIALYNHVFADYRWTRGQMYMGQFAMFLFLFFMYNLTNGYWGVPRLTQQRCRMQLASEGPHYTFDVPE